MTEGFDVELEDVLDCLQLVKHYSKLKQADVAKCAEIRTKL